MVRIGGSGEVQGVPSDGNESVGITREMNLPTELKSTSPGVNSELATRAADGNLPVKNPSARKALFEQVLEALGRANVQF